MLEIILSSVVIVAIIQMIVQNKNNKLQYITNERSIWRKDIIEIAQALEREKKPKKMKALLNCLKLRLNYYGKCYDKYPDSLKLDFFRDQHIWEIIDRIEKGEGDLEDDKIKLLDCLGLLLKYDWERTKRETTINFGIIISAIVYFSGAIVNMVGLYLVGGKDNTIEIYMLIAITGILYLFAYFCFLLPYLIEKYKYLKFDKPFKGIAVCWIMGFICLQMVLGIFSIVLYIPFFIIGVIGSTAGIIMTMCKEIEPFFESLRYSDKIIECLQTEKLKIFYYKDEDKVLWARLNLDKWNLNSKFYNIKEADEELDAIIDKLNEKEILKKRYRFFYSIYKRGNSNGMKDYIKKHPRSMNLILEYKGKYAVGCTKKKIDNLKLD